MDPDNVTPFIDLKDENKSDTAVVDDIFKVQHSDSESVLDFAISESELEEDQHSTSEDDIEDGKSVHIIFVRDENENSAQTSPEKFSTMNGSVETFSEGTSVTIHSPLPEGEESDLPCRVVTCPNEASGSESEVMNYVSDRNTDEEVEEDFDTSTEVMIQESPLPGAPRKRKKKKVCKVCKVCGMSVERKDLLSHIREHRLRKSKFAQNKSPDTSEKPSETLEPPRKPLSPTEKVSLLSNSVRTVSNMEGEKNFPQSFVNNSASDRPFKCNVCSETFRTQSGLTIHFKSHSAECSNSCPVS